MSRRSGSGGRVSLLVCCLLFAILSAPAHAARPRHLRNRPTPPSDILLPPGGLGSIVGETPSRALREHKFTLRHVYHHGIQQYPDLHRYIDVPTDAELRITDDYGKTTEDAPGDLIARSQTMNIQRMSRRSKSDIDALLEHVYYTGTAAELPASAWVEDEIAGPNITDKTTILTFARVAANAYVISPEDRGWIPVKGGFNYTNDFGWEADGLRGHIFADETNKTVVIGLKGTSPAIFDGADTTGNDKLNDNLFGSCCCGQGGPISWKTVCDCMTSTYTCNSTCLAKELRVKGHYYRSVRELYSNVTERYPDSDVWLAGHSLGGVVSSLLGLTYGLPTLTYEAFPDAMAAKRLGLPTPPGFRIGAHHARPRTGIHHFGHTADPIFMGQCNGGLSFCSIAGYAFQGLCHTGQTCTYDTITDFGWRSGIGTHKIVNVIKDVLEKYDTVAGCETDEDCEDCPLWKFYESDGTETTTTSSPTTTHTRTRTETCKTPGWWGCLDETSTSRPTKAPSATTSTCKTPGWFGCNDEISTTTSPSTSKTTTAPSTTAATETCRTPGWFGGCHDSSTITSAPAKPSPTMTTTAASHTDDCTSREWFGLICVDPSPTTTATTTAASQTETCTSRGFFGLICVDPAPTATSSSIAGPSPTNPPTRRKHCAARHWYGFCKEWRWLETPANKVDL